MLNSRYTICCIGGDGIGPEVILAAQKLLAHLPLKLDYIELRAGYQCYLDTGSALPDETITACKKSNAILFGAVTTPPESKNYSSPIVELRNLLGLYANVRPIFSLPLPQFHREIDFVIVRENTEGL